MLPKELRITETYDFNLVRKFGKSVSCPYLVISFLKDKRALEGSTRFGIIVTNKIDKRSVERHKIQRILSRILSENLEHFGKGYLVVLIARQPISNKSYEEVLAEFNQALSKISLP